MTRFRLAAIFAAMIVFDAVLPAGVVTYTLNNRRFFPVVDGVVADTITNPLTIATAVSDPTNYTDPLTGNQFNALSGITGTPFQLATLDTVTINQATTSSCCGILSLVSANVSESGVTITGGSGTGYLLPTFRVHGTFTDNNAGLELGISTCAGNVSCILTSPAFTVTPGVQNVDVLFTPGISSSTAFQFNTPFGFFFFLEAGIEYLGAQADPGGTSTVDFRMELVGVQVTDVNGTPIPGVQINSNFLEIAAPEPGSIWLCGLALAAACGAVMRFRQRLV